MLRFRQQLQWPQKHLFPPGIYVAECRLSGFQTDKARNNRAVHLPANPRNQLFGDILFRSNHNIAGRGADDLHHRVRSYPGPDSSCVSVDNADSHIDALRQSKPPCPLFGKFPCRHITRVCFVPQTGRKSIQQGIECGKEILRGITAPR
ncbi:hypothetical protein SDC9_175712 [bioreactor metagenome]|uniref:Uncharacterized protein n=1 Tax=bioreactor metagenome TaxID=1076179 RepID=A0A645GMU0_9ZZZZ